MALRSIHVGLNLAACTGLQQLLARVDDHRAHVAADTREILWRPYVRLARLSRTKSGMLGPPRTGGEVKALNSAGPHLLQATPDQAIFVLLLARMPRLSL